MQVEVVYALPGEQDLLMTDVPEGATVQQAIDLSGVLQRYLELAERPLTLGIFSRKVTADSLLSAGDRIEIYRSLTIDPKQARAIRARKKS